MRITVIGAGHVGLVSAVCFAAIGHDVVALDIDRDRIALLASGRVPFHEPHLQHLLGEALASGRITFTTDTRAGLAEADLAFLCVATPNDPDGSVDLSAVVAATRSFAQHATPNTVFVNRSTAPVGTAAYLRTVLEEVSGRSVPVAVNPEFLAEGSAVANFLYPDRIVIGGWDAAARARVRAAYDPIADGSSPVALDDGRARAAGPVPVVETLPPTAELVKYASNAFLAMKISFINEIALIAEEVGGDVTEVSRGVGLDHRIGPEFLNAGLGWGGSCFPKDIQALEGMAALHGLDARLLRAANDVNRDQKRWVVRKLQRHLKSLVGRQVVLLGLAFKPNTDDLRDAPALEIAMALAKANVRVKAYDPIVRRVPDALAEFLDVVDDPIEAARHADAAVLVTDWPEFRELDPAALGSVMRERLFLDGRNFLDRERLEAAGFTYVGVGR